MSLFGKSKTEVNSTVIGWGSVGKGMGVAHHTGSSFLNDLKKAGFNIMPITFISPNTVARGKNALALHEFQACKEEYMKLLSQYVPGSVYTVSAVGVGGGTGGHGIEITEYLREMTEYLTLRMYFTHEIFQQRLGYAEIARRYINSNFQLGLAGEKLKKGVCSVEILSMSDMLKQFGKSYNEVDQALQDCINVMISCSVHPGNGFDIEDVLCNPVYKIRTLGFREIPILNRYEAMITRILAALKDMKPLMGSNYFNGDNKLKVIGSPMIIIAGPSEIVMNIQDGFNFLNGGEIRSMDDIEKVIESSSATANNAMLVPFPAALSNVYLAAIYPVDEKYFLQQCASAKKKIQDLYEKSRKSSNDTLMARVFRSMMAQAGNPNLEDLLE